MNLHFSHILRLLQRYRGWTIATVGFIVLTQAAQLVEPALYRRLIILFEDIGSGTIANPAASHVAITIVVAFIIMHATAMLGNSLMFYAMNRLSANIMRDSATEFVETVLNLSFRFHLDRKTGKLSQEFARGINGIEAVLDSFAFSFIGLAIRFGTVVIVFTRLQWSYAAIIAIMAAVFCGFVVYSAKLMQRRRVIATESEDASSSRALDALMNVETVKLFAQEGSETRHFVTARQHWRDSKLREWDGWTYVVLAQIGIIATSSVGLIALLLWQVLHGHNSVGDAVLVITYLGMIIGALWEFTHHARRFMEASTDIKHFFGYFAEEQEIIDQPNAKPLQVTAGSVQFDAVSFGYSDQSHIIEKVSFTIHPGESLAFVGPSGVGKSTIMKLLYRFFEPQSGRILIDGQDIQTVTQESLRNSLSIVPQSTNLFNASIADNIRYGTPGVSQADIERVATLASAHQFINRLPNGYDTRVGEQGIKLSGGEKQRIAIARAFLRNAPILILDEATASLDSQSEHVVQQALDELMADRTTLIIAHRLSTIMHASRIIVLSAGSVAEVGTHQELLQAGGLYKKLWQLQAGEYNE